MKLSIKAFALTAGLLWGGYVLSVALINLAAPAYGRAFLEFWGSIYPGVHANQTVGSVVLVTLYGLADGGIGGAIFAWLYNRFAG
jgi:hypothetical protein